MRKQITQLIDDLDGTFIDGIGVTVGFSLEGKNYEIDLAPSNLERLREALAPYVKAGRVVSVGRTRRNGSSRNPSSDLRAIRAWANANGHPVGDRGRIPESIRAAYDAAR